MIPEPTIAAFVISALFTLLLPVILLIVLGIARKITAIPLFAGVGAFFLSQIVLRIPLITVLSAQAWYQEFAKLAPLYVFALSFSASLFEESARLGGAALLKKRRSYKDAVSFGLGHAFCEVVILIGLAHINNIVFCLLINSGNEAAMSTLSADVIQTAKNTLLALNPADVYWGILERFSAVLFHIFMTVLVFRGVREKKAAFYLLAIGAHTLFNYVGVMCASYAGIAVSEIAMLALALAAGIYVLKQRESFSEPPGDVQSTAAPPAL